MVNSVRNGRFCSKYTRGIARVASSCLVVEQPCILCFLDRAQTRDKNRKVTQNGRSRRDESLQTQTTNRHKSMGMPSTVQIRPNVLFERGEILLHCQDTTSARSWHNTHLYSEPEKHNVLKPQLKVFCWMSAMVVQWRGGLVFASPGVCLPVVPSSLCAFSQRVSL